MPQNADGTAHIAYYDPERLLSFIWDGKSDVIEVSHGGYGEPVTDTFKVHPIISEADNPARLMSCFEILCERYARQVWDRNNDPAPIHA